MAEALHQVWRCQWGTDSDLRNWACDGVPHITAQRLDRDITSAYERGAKDGAPAAERVGAVRFAQELRKRMQYWLDLAHHGDVPAMPAWDLQRLLEEWNIPPADDA